MEDLFGMSACLFGIEAAREKKEEVPVAPLVETRPRASQEVSPVDDSIP